jgi:hypothetical protein
MEIKWITIMVVGVLGSISIGTTIDRYADKQCRIEAIKAHVDPDKISLACEKK